MRVLDRTRRLQNRGKILIDKRPTDLGIYAENKPLTIATPMRRKLRFQVFQKTGKSRRCDGAYGVTLAGAADTKAARLRHLDRG